jgi:hypothetical protein
MQVLPVEAVLLIADLAHDIAHGRLDFLLRAGRPVALAVDHAIAAHLARQHDELGGGERLAGDARLGVFGKEKIDDGVGNLVRHLVGMAFGNAFGGEEIVGTHGFPSHVRCCCICV